MKSDTKFSRVKFRNLPTGPKGCKTVEAKAWMHGSSTAASPDFWAVGEGETAEAARTDAMAALHILHRDYMTAQ